MKRTYKKRVGVILSVGTRKKMSDAKIKNPIRYWLGKKRPATSDSTKKKIRDSMKGRKNFWLKGKPSWNKGKKLPQSSGENHPRWKGGYKRKLWNNLQRRIKRLGNGGSHTFAEWELLKAQYNWTCPCCKKSEPTIQLTEDHIIPVSKGGSDNIENIQPLCKSCNCRKSAKVIKYKL